MASSLFAQTVVTDTNGRVTVRNSNDSVLVQIDSIGSGAVSAVFDSAKSEIVVAYSSGVVLVKDATGGLIATIGEASDDKAIAANWSGNNIIITTQSNLTLTKDSREWRQ